MNARQAERGNWIFALVVAVLFAIEHGRSVVADDVPGQAAFLKGDKDEDKRLSLEEYLASFEAEPPKDAKRNHAVCDFDGDGSLSLDEYRCLPGVVPKTDRGPVPDPIVDLANGATAVLRGLAMAADKNGDGQLDESEWPRAEIAKQIPAFSELPFATWDRDGDGKVSEAERDLVIGIGFATRHDPSGEAIRSPQGIVLHVEWVTPADKNHDGVIDEAEFVASYWLKPEERADFFKTIDPDQDGRLTIQELNKAPAVNVDVLSAFLAVDQDLDGFLSAEELLANKSSGATPIRVPQAMAAFDDNGDGKFSLREFQLAPIGIGYVTYSSFNRNDVDQDGWLSWIEFHPGQTLPCIGLAKELFRRFDRDENGRLSLDEFEFSTPPEKVSPEVAVRLLDRNRNGGIEWDEFALARAKDDLKVTQRNFRFVDFDGDGTLTADEYLALPGVLPVKQRRPVPDPVAVLAAGARSVSDDHASRADKNQDGAVSSEEWAALPPPVELRPLNLDEFAAWDLNGDGKVEPAERERFIAVAYGLTTVDGTTLRTPAGSVLFTTYLSPIDVNQDGVVSREEFVPTHWLGEEKAGALFTELDVDKNERLSWAEFAETGSVNVDTASAFLLFDTDLDARLSPAEIEANGSVGPLVTKMKQVIPAFDDDGDGSLSFPEYRLCPFGIGYVTLRIEGRRDLNGDGELGWLEFFPDPTPAFSGIAWANFTRLDRDKSGQLSPKELDFAPASGEVVAPRLVFRLCDKDQDQRLDREEFGLAQKSVDPKLVERNFRLVDFDEDGRLTLAEFLAIPGFLPLRERSNIPDPMFDLAKQALEEWSRYVATADTDRNQRLSSAEWAGQNRPETLFPLNELEFAAWDRGGDGEIDANDASALIDLAYGLRHVDGSPLRSTNGMVLFLSHIRRADKDADGRLSKAEFLTSFWRTKDVAEPLFLQLDQDQNEQLDYRELATSDDMNINVPGMFVLFDTDLDARLNVEELAANGSTGATVDDVARTLPAFDDNADGVISYREFVSMPLSPGYVVMYILDKRDLDHDGRLAWSEFRPDSAPALVGLAGYWFRRLDRDRNGTLDLKELRFQFDASKLPPEVLLQVRDANQDGKITWPEQERFVPPSDRQRGFRNFRLVDFDGNDALDLEELKALPGLLPPESRGAIPDPVAELAAEALKSWRAFAATADQDGDQCLARREWSTSTLAAQLGPVGEIPFSTWDRDRDGEISDAEAVRLVAIAYALCDESGAPLRTSTGHVLYTTFSRRMEQNGDQSLNLAEFTKNHWLGTQRAIEIFHEMDENKDGQVAYGELARSHTTNVDVFNAFVALDVDLDGFIGKSEISTSGASGASDARIQSMLDRFDKNLDGKFSLREYLLMPIGMGYVSYDVYYRTDENGNGYLDWKEFFPESGPLFLGLAAALFERFDADHDGRLGVDEFEFTVEPHHIPPEMSFRMQDRNRDSRLTFAEAFVEPKPADERPEELERYQVRMALAEDRFQADDTNADGFLSPDEFAKSRAAAAELAERHRRAMGKSGAAAGFVPSDWLFPAFVVGDVILLLGAAWYFLKPRRKQ
jgi:Ca2+-binding EF-hand superfamily protein